MEKNVLLCTDGSELALNALRAGLAVLGPADRVVLATVVDPGDPTLVTGTGMAGGVISPEAFDAMQRDQQREAQAMLDATRSSLGLDGVETVLLDGTPGPALCDYAAALPASVIVVGTRGRGGLRRAVLGSVSDYLVRNAPCPVLTTGAG